MARTRARFSTSSGPARTYGTSTARTEDPLDVAARHARDQATIDKYNDPYTKNLAKLNNELKQIEDNARLSELASGKDPSSIIAYATTRLKGMDKSDPDYAKWKGLLDTATQKADELDWGAQVKAGTKSLEDFRDHVKERLASAEGGSKAARDYATNLGEIAHQITARDENRKDVAAYSKYANDTSITGAKAYKDYLSGKLSRTTDARIQSDIAKQIQDISSRITSQEGADRAQRAMKVETDQRSGAMNSAKAVAALQKIASEPGATSAEVNHLQTITDGIFNRDKADAIRASAAARSGAGKSGGKTGANAKEEVGKLNEARTELEKAQTKIKNKIANGQTVTDDDLNDVDIAAKLVTEMSEAVAKDPGSSAGTSRSARTEASQAAQAGDKARADVDKATLGGLDISKEGLSAFNAKVAAEQDPVKKAQLLADHALDLKYAGPKMRSNGAQERVANLASQAASATEKAIQLAAAPKPLDTDSIGQLRAMHAAYTAAGGTVPFPTWLKTLQGNTDRSAAGKELGAPISEKSWNAVQGLVQPASYNAITDSFDGNPASSLRLTGAMNVMDQFVRGQFGTDVSLSKGDLFLNATGQANLLDTVANKFGGAAEGSGVVGGASGTGYGGSGFSSDYYTNPWDAVLAARNKGGGGKPSPTLDNYPPDQQEVANDTSSGSAEGYGISGAQDTGITPPNAQEVANDATSGSAEGYGNEGSQNGGMSSDQRTQLFGGSDPIEAALRFLDSPTPIDFQNSFEMPPLPPEPSFASEVSSFAASERYDVGQDNYGLYTPPQDNYTPPPDAGGYEGDTTGVTHGN